MPEPLSWKEFLGEAPQPLDGVEELNAQTRLKDISCKEQVFAKDEYTFHVGVKNRTFNPNKFKYLIVVAHNGTPIGFRHFGLVYLQPEHRGKGLGAELNVQLFLLAGSEVWRERQWRIRVTPSGYSSLKNAYAMLIERGHVYDPTSTLHTTDMFFSVDIMDAACRERT